MMITLDQVQADIMQRLQAGASNRRSAMHTPVVVTSDADARVMVLRAFDPSTQTARFHTDGRAPKAALIRHSPGIGILFYDRDAKVQIRCRGQGEILTSGALVDDAWKASTPFARRCYLGDAPGKIASEPTSGLPPQFEGVEPSEAELASARPNFAILQVMITSFDWFHLAQTGHRRAVFDDAGARWITP